MSQPVADRLGAGDIFADRAGIMNRGKRVVQTLACDGAPAQPVR